MTGWWCKIILPTSRSRTEPALPARQPSRLPGVERVSKRFESFRDMEMNWTVEKLVEATQGELLQGNSRQSIRRVSTDTRQLLPGDCFVALRGEVCDGHDFIPAALAGGAGALVLSRCDSSLAIPPQVAVVRVGDTLYALGEMARHYRRQHPLPLVGVTGSNGKTSTREMIAVILAENHCVLKNHSNFNNLIGVPLTLLELQPCHGMAVVEMGINVPGEMERLLAITNPTVGLITNIQSAHLEGLRSVDHVLQEKGKLLLGLGVEDLAIVNRDDERLRKLATGIRARTVSYSLQDPTADVTVSGPVEMREAGSRFGLKVGGQTLAVELPVLGLHQVTNALAAAAVAHGLGETPETIAAGLAKHRPVQQRMQLHRIAPETVLIDDTYNANPVSMLAAIQSVVSASQGRPVVAVLGEMRELGEQSARLHRELGRQIGALGIHQLLTLGDLAEEISRGAVESGMPASVCRHAQSHQQIVDRLEEQ